MASANIVEPNSYKAKNHFYTKAFNTSICPEVKQFFHLDNKQIALEYCRLHPNVNYEKLYSLLSIRPSILHWSGADLFHVIDDNGKKQMIVLEINSCPSGQKSLPAGLDFNNESGYHQFVRLTFTRVIRAAEDAGKLLKNGYLAVIYDKNPMENGGYAAAMADVFGEPVYSVELHSVDPDPPVKFINKIMYVRTNNSEWVPIRAAFRYVTQSPWFCLPVQSKTLIVNPIVACLAGGRNKNLADYAYQMFNQENDSFGLSIRTPLTFRNLSKGNIPNLIESLGGRAVVKIPYSNAGQGVFTITNKKELNEFMEIPEYYKKYVVQSLVGCSTWKKDAKCYQSKNYYHVGTTPNDRNEVFAADLRIQIFSTENGFRPLAIYGRRAAVPLSEQLNEDLDSWSMLGTNLSKRFNDCWTTEAERLLVVDQTDWNILGLTMIDLIDGYVQTVLANIAIDRLAEQLLKPNGSFNSELFQMLNDDSTLLNEIFL